MAKKMVPEAAVFGEAADDAVSSDEDHSLVTVPPPSFPRFMDLAVEIREMIWEHAMRGTLHIADLHGEMRVFHLETPVEIREFIRIPNNTERPNFLPAMCRTSKLTMQESIGVYIRCSHFMVASIHDDGMLDGFLQTVDHCYETIQSIHLPSSAVFPRDLLKMLIWSLPFAVPAYVRSSSLFIGQNSP